jgi:hypothetical protein
LPADAIWNMDDLLLLLLEALLEIAGEALFDLICRAASSVLAVVFETGPALAMVAYLIVGALTGGASLSLFPHPLVHSSRFHGISLLISPALAGGAMSLMGLILKKQDKHVSKIESFGYGWTFAFGMALVRFAFAR